MVDAPQPAFVSSSFTRQSAAAGGAMPYGGMVSCNADSSLRIAMLRTVFALFLAAASASILPAQVADPGAAVGIGHLHLRVSEADYPAHRKALVDGLGL